MPANATKSKDTHIFPAAGIARNTAVPFGSLAVPLMLCTVKQKERPSLISFASPPRPLRAMPPPGLELVGKLQHHFFRCCVLQRALGEEGGSTSIQKPGPVCKDTQCLS